MIRNNDEPVYEDALGHYELVKSVGRRIHSCHPPYVIGVCGSWGSGKTSFLRKLWAYLGGPVSLQGKTRKNPSSLRFDEHEDWFREEVKAFDDLRSKKLELIWFNPWQHQFESSPVVALLHEIRRHFSLKKKVFDKAGKMIDVSTHGALDILSSLGKDFFFPVPSAKTLMERGREYEAEHFSTRLTSQQFRDFFEAAIRSVAGNNGRLVIFIDDLDRCEGEVAYRLLEALKLYLNAENCVYVLGLDQQHLEMTIARALSGEKENWRYRPLARDYLNKMFQGLFLLPVPRVTTRYITEILDAEDAEFKHHLQRVFGLDAGSLSILVQTLDEILPHNPRKIKSFISAWKLHLELIPEPPSGKLDWRLSLILHYLGQFEEPLFRKVEEAPGFYSDHVVRFCVEGYNSHPLFEGLERPYAMSKAGAPAKSKPELSEDPGGFSTPPSPVSPQSPNQEEKSVEPKLLPQPRIFWISSLVRNLASDFTVINDEMIHSHLLRTGIAAELT